MAQALFAATMGRIEMWKARPDVRGVIQVGSKARGHGDALSDDDVEVVLSEEAFARLEPATCIEFLAEGDGDGRRLVWDAQYLPLSTLEKKASSPHDLDHWPYEQAPVHWDRDGAVRAAVAAAGAMRPTFRRARLRNAALDAWVACRRAEKTRDRGAPRAARMLVNRGARALTRVLFALEGRWVPLDHWLEAELRTLADPTRSTARLLEAIERGDPAPVLAALDALAPALAAEGVPVDRPARQALFIELVHPRNAVERATHSVV